MNAVVFSPPKEEITDLSFLEYFQSDRPVEIEIGCGKGRFLFSRAERCPEINFLGFDRVSKWMKRKSRRSEKEGVRNLKFVKAEAREVLKQHVPSGRVSVFYVYFPDPWPKRRHNRRRLINREFLSLLYDRLTPGGRIQVATDDPDYFLHIKTAAESGAITWTGTHESLNQKLGDWSEKTNYELKFEAQKKNIFYLELTK
ncbi:MAG TPA: tRNA (guanosine(46)-N7)-methyltransferase TrmB [bacterium]|nr:tRNA (guanosine(46)-N7)-methyltransferase TrmB [bacterium]